MLSSTNSNPLIREVSFRRTRPQTKRDYDDTITDPIDKEEIFGLIRDIKDPEHPLTLEQLNVVSLDDIDVNVKPSTIPMIRIEFTPTIPHCSMATLIGLCLIVKLNQCLPYHIKLDVRVKSGTHASEDAINKQLRDKERVAAAMENPQLIKVVNQCIITSN